MAQEVHLWGWDVNASDWVKCLVDESGRLIIDPTDVFEDTPTEDEHGKGPASSWAFDHKEAPSAHHTKYTDIEARASMNHIHGPTGKITQTLDVNSHKLINVVDPTVDQGAATKKYVDDKGVLPGSIMAWPTESAPSGWLECNGASLLRSAYADLFALIGVMYGSADGTHFNIPDLRGRFVRGWDHGSGTDPDSATRTDRGDSTTGDHVGTQQADEFKSHSHNIRYITYVAGGGANVALNHGGGYTAVGAALPKGGDETRPTNINLMWCIKT